MDSTMIEVECIDELADYAGVKPQVSDITERAMRGELDFEEALRERVSLLKGLPVSVLQECYNQRITFSPGAAALLAGLRGAGVETALVSGGFTFFSERVAAELGFHSHQANSLEVDNGHLTGRVTPPILGRAAKEEALRRISERLGISPFQAVAIGDGANDLAMIGAAGLGIAYKAKPAVAAEADVRLDHSDLSAVLALIGVALP
ncbi:phosphoserine phosphatase SerB [Algicella marina]|uniref:Phosphoserine phosphatase n=2 Tax=Algicella marina TaxID=2683284 RepID=A0A6P1T9M9_9RHOB|nr:phosphoserine phosphatase SerB [Algicella marina]